MMCAWIGSCCFCFPLCDWERDSWLGAVEVEGVVEVEEKKAERRERLAVRLGVDLEGGGRERLDFLREGM